MAESQPLLFPFSPSDVANSSAPSRCTHSSSLGSILMYSDLHHEARDRAESYDDFFTRKTLCDAVWYSTALFLFIATGVIFYAFAGGLSPIYALYFTIITLTTVGYGDSHPGGDFSKVFTCVYVFLGLIMMAAALSWLLEYALKRREDTNNRRRLQAMHAEDALVSLGDTNSCAPSNVYNTASIKGEFINSAPVETINIHEISGSDRLRSSSQPSLAFDTVSTAGARIDSQTTTAFPNTFEEFNGSAAGSGSRSGSAGTSRALPRPISTTTVVRGPATSPLTHTPQPPPAPASVGQRTSSQSPPPTTGASAGSAAQTERRTEIKTETPSLLIGPESQGWINIALDRLLRIVLRKQAPEYVLDFVKDLIKSFLQVLCIVIIGAVMYHRCVDDFSVVDSVYLSCMTVFTVGYGDLTPSTSAARIFTVLYAVFGTYYTASALGTFAGALGSYKQTVREHLVLSKTLDLESLLAMDVDLSRTVSKEEFVVFKLLRMGLVDKAHVSRIEDQFHHLDRNKDGELTIEDIMLFDRKCADRSRTSFSSPPSRSMQTLASSASAVVSGSGTSSNVGDAKNDAHDLPGSDRAGGGVPTHGEASYYQHQEGLV